MSTDTFKNIYEDRKGKMPIVAADVENRYSGGAANVTPDLSIGGAMSTVAGGIVADDTLNNDMSDITSAQALAGVINYRGRYYKNAHGTLTYISPVMWIDSQTSSADTAVAIAIAAEDVNTAIETLANQFTAPATVVFSAPANFAAGLPTGAIGDGNLDAGEYRGHWVRYTVNAGASAALDTYTLSVRGDTNP